jgi:hypothetical protein
MKSAHKLIPARVYKLISGHGLLSPVTLACEAAWRAWRPRRKALLQSALLRGEPGVHFRPVPYYRPDLIAASEGAAPIVAYADQICAGRFPFPGYETADLGFPPHWNLDFVSGYEWNPVPAEQLRPLVRHNGSDIKVPWELSRLQFLPVLAKAHLLTGKQDYRDAAKALFSDWRAKNPVGIGVNWTLAMESALRGMSLCFTLSLMQPLRPDEQAWADSVAQSIWQHLLATEANIEFSFLVQSNHYLSNIVGLHCMATFLDAPGMERRRKKYRRLIQRAMLRQVYEDGGDYEASFSYHLLVLQMFTNAYLLMRSDNDAPTPRFTQRLRAMYRYLGELAGEDGSVPHVGDSDDGRVELLVSDLRQMTSLPREKRNSLLVPGAIALGDALFDLGCDGDPSDAAWYGLHPKSGKSPRARTVVFRRSGVAVGRTDSAEVVFCAIPNGIHGAGSHTHNDKLSIVVRIGATELFCDSGSGWYTRDARLRNQLRRTDAHNTVVIDGAEQNAIHPQPDYLFTIGNQAAVSAIDVTDSGGEIRFSASHSGYSRIGVLHRRTVRLSENRISIEDSLLGTGNHSFEMFWRLPAPWRLENVLQRKGFEISGPACIRMNFESELALELSHQPSPISRTYGGALQEATRLRIAGSGSFPCTVVTAIVW